MLVPRPAVVLRTEDLPGAAHAVDLVGIPWMERHGHHRALGLDAVVEARPGLAEVSAAVERSVLAARGRAEACVEDAGIVRRHAERSEEHTSELQSLTNLVCRLLLEKKN